MRNSGFEENRICPELSIEKRGVAKDFGKKVDAVMPLLEMGIILR